MAFSGDTFTRLFSWVVNAGNGIKIRSDYMDQDTNDIANGLTTVAGRITTLSTASLKQDGGGNVGIGGTAAGWVGTIGLQAPGDVALAAPFNVHLVSNAYSVSGTWKYLTTGGASRVTTAQGVTSVFSAASGTAGNNITWITGLVQDINGNVGLGVSPSPWNLGGYRALEVGAAGSGLYGTSKDLNVVANAYYSTGWKYAAAGSAGIYEINASTHQWFTSVAGAAGASITFIPSMTLDGSGNLLLGSTSALTSAAGRGNVEISGSANAILSLNIAGSNAGYVYHTGAAGMQANSNIGPVSLAIGGVNKLTVSTAGVVTDSTAELGWKDVPVNSQGSGYTLVLADRGKQVLISTGGVTVPNAVFSAGAIITITNNSVSAQTITQGTSLTMHQAGTTNTGNRTLAPWGVCSVLFIAASNCVISGNVS